MLISLRFAAYMSSACQTSVWSTCPCYKHDLVNLLLVRIAISWWYRVYCPTNQGRKIKASHPYLPVTRVRRMPVELRSNLQISPTRFEFWRRSLGRLQLLITPAAHFESHDLTWFLSATISSRTAPSDGPPAPSDDTDIALWHLHLLHLLRHFVFKFES